jgi:hypothetical protein
MWIRRPPRPVRLYRDPADFMNSMVFTKLPSVARCQLFVARWRYSLNVDLAARVDHVLNKELPFTPPDRPCR